MGIFSKIVAAGLAIVLGASSTLVEAKCSPYGDCKRVDMLARLDVTALGWSKDTMCTSIWGWVDDRTNKKYVILSCEPGHTLIDISEPSKPRAVASIMGEQGSLFRWRDVKVYKDHAFMVSDALLSKVQVVDLKAMVDSGSRRLEEVNEEEEEEEDSANGASLRGLRRAASGKNVPKVKAATVYTGGGIFQSHNLEVNEDSGFAYAVGGGNNCNNGMHMIDIRDPENPKFAGCYSHPSNPYIHDAHCRSYTKEHLGGKYAGREICFAFAVNAVISIDVTDKKNPRTLSLLRYDGASYVHQGWSTTDRSFLMVDDERDQPGQGIKTFILDIRDVENLKLAHVHVAVGETFGDHNQYVVKIGEHDYSFQANYAGGLRVLRINRGPVKGRSDDEILSLEEVAYFDANPSNGNQMEGVWSVWPFFTEEKLVVFADMDTGFYVTRWEFEDTDPAIPYKALNGKPTPAPTAWANCPNIKSADACNKEPACTWDMDWQMVQGWTAGCEYAPGAVKPPKPYRAPAGGASACSRLNKTQCGMFPACIFRSKCQAYQD